MNSIFKHWAATALITVSSGTGSGTSRRCGVGWLGGGVGRLGRFGGRSSSRSSGRSCSRSCSRSGCGRGGGGSGSRLGFFFLATSGDGQSKQRSNEEGVLHGGVPYGRWKTDKTSQKLEG